MKQFEIKSHDGPGRYGKLGDLETPAIINKDDFSIADDESSAYDVEKEIARINKELEAQKKFLNSLNAKLSNEKFVSRAPEAVVNAEREKAAKARDLIAQLEQSQLAMKKI